MIPYRNAGAPSSHLLPNGEKESEALRPSRKQSIIEAVCIPLRLSGPNRLN
jgi:hypothetical protein